MKFKIMIIIPSFGAAVNLAMVPIKVLSPVANTIP